MRLDARATCRREAVRAAALVAVSLTSRAASAKYGEFARMPAKSGFSVGEESNECLFAQPGTGNCMVDSGHYRLVVRRLNLRTSGTLTQVYKSSEPALWAAPDKQVALTKLVRAAASLDNIGADIDAGRWTAVSQTLGASMDLQEAARFLSAGDAQSAKLAKQVFSSLQNVAVATQKRNAAVAKKYFEIYSQEMPALIIQLGSNSAQGG